MMICCKLHWQCTSNRAISRVTSRGFDITSFAFVTDRYIDRYIHIMTDNFWVILYPFCAEVGSRTIIDRVISRPTSCRYKMGMCIRLCEKKLSVIMTSWWRHQPWENFNWFLRKLAFFGRNFHPKASDFAQNGFNIMHRKFTKLSNGNVQISFNIFLVWAAWN